MLEPQIRFTNASDGVSICYAAVGQGPPLVKAANWLSHLEFDWHSPVWRHWWQQLSQDHLLVRYDERGCGLSDWAAEDFSFDTLVNDLETVVDTIGLDRFPLLGISQGGPVAIAFAARHPERVSKLVLYGTYNRGRDLWDTSPSSLEEHAALQTLMRSGWGRDDPAYRQILAAKFVSGATKEQIEWLNDLQGVSTSAETFVKLQDEFGKVILENHMTQVLAPTLVLHARNDAVVPFQEGRRVAASIPNARFVPLEGKNHILLEDDPAWPVFLSEIRRFLGVADTSRRTPVSATPRHSAVGVRPVDADVAAEEASREARSLITGMDDISLSRFDVVPGYAKYDEEVRNILKDARQKIAEGLQQSSGRRDNHLFWAASGSGKTYFVQQVVASLPIEVRLEVCYQELNLAGSTQDHFLTGLEELDRYNGPCLCLIDEVDAKPGETWPYEALLPYLDAALSRETGLVFVMAGSSGSNISEMKQRLAARPKGADLLSRIPGVNEYQIPPMGLGDRILVALSQFRQAGREAGRDVQSVEKLGLYYVAVTPRLANARQLREFAVRAVQRMPHGEDRVKYDHLFSAGDEENKEFYMLAVPAASDLVNRYVSVED